MSSMTTTSLKAVIFSAPKVGLVSHGLVLVLQDPLTVLANNNVTMYMYIQKHVPYLVFIFFCNLPFETVHYSTFFLFTTGKLPINVNLMKLIV